MIILKELRWGNLFSYGDNNTVILNAAPLTQIVGFNGHGKSSIALVLEEVLFNKNSKDIKKADILNRNSSAKSYWIELIFSKDSKDYVVKTTRGSTQTVKLFCDGVDISAHTATATYKELESILGMDHKTFTQILYQSNASSLEFLTATDGKRKKFLIDLFSLNRYTECGEVFKEVLKDTKNEILILNTKIEGCNSWITKHSKLDLEYKPLVVVPETPDQKPIIDLQNTINNIDVLNKAIVQNNKYLELMESITLGAPISKPPSAKAFIDEKVELELVIRQCTEQITKNKVVGTHCTQCKQPINNEQNLLIVKEKTEVKEATAVRVAELKILINDIAKQEKEWQGWTEDKRKYEEYHSLYDPKLDKNPFDLVKGLAKLKKLKAEYADTLKEIKDLEDFNTKTTIHNSKVDVILEQLVEYNSELKMYKADLDIKMAKSARLHTLIKTFSVAGLVAYKLECLVKDLEVATNAYLADLSSGRFYITFRIQESDKLNVIITDNGKDIDMLALSGGERARVNTAALLGIRKILQSISNNQINLLILDETIESLDLEGKEKLIEVLLQEVYLNTFIISHGFSHPLLEKLQIVKINNISRIE